MIKLFFKLITRNITRNLTFSIINIVGFAIGLTCSLIILLWIKNELNYDKFHEDYDRIYRLVSYGTQYMQDGYIGGPYILTNTAKEQIPEIEEAVPIRLQTFNTRINYEDVKLFEDRVLISDSTFFNLFNYNILAGDPNELYKNPSSIIITKSLSQKLFGNENPINKEINIDGDPFTVGVLLEDPPTNSSFDFRMIIPFNYFLNAGYNLNSWGSFMTSSFFKIQPGADLSKIENQLTEIARENNCTQVIEGVEFKLQALTDIHTDNYHGNYLTYSKLVDKNILRIFFAISIIILILAIINYINLATANTIQRRKEISIKKITGANRKQIVTYLLGESFIVIFIAFDIAILLIETITDKFNTLAGKNLDQHFIFKADNLLLVTLIFLFTWFISSIYPAILLSSSKAIDILRKSMSGFKNKLLSRFKSILVIFQFFISITLIIGALNIYKQVNYLKNKDLGFDINNILYVWNKGAVSQNYNYFKAELLKNPNISQVSVQDHLWVKTKWHTTGLRWGGMTEEDDNDMQASLVGFDFLETFNIPILEGRDFDVDIPTDSTLAFIVNKSAAKQIGVDNIIGHPFSILRNGEWHDGKIIGLIDDLHFESLYHTIDPFFIAIEGDPGRMTNLGAILIKHNGQDLKNTIRYIEKLWTEIDPNTPFFYESLSDTYKNKYKKADNIGIIILIFTSLAIIISCLGLYGMSAFVIDKRRKELAMRKVNGASPYQIFRHLLINFSGGLLISLVIAIPTSYYFINKWLETFAYRTNIAVSSFFIAVIAVFIINTLTIFIKTYKAAKSNPIKSLRYE